MIITWPQIWHIWPTFLQLRSIISGAWWHLCRPQVWTVQQPSPPPLYFSHRLLVPDGIWVWRVDFLLPQPYNCMFPFLFLQLHPFIHGSASSLISTAPKRTNYFLLPHFLSSFPAESFSFLASFPLIPQTFFLWSWDCLYNGEAWKARLSPSELG